MDNIHHYTDLATINLITLMDISIQFGHYTFFLM